LAYKKLTAWPESTIELYRPSDRRLSAKLVPTSADRECRVVSATDPCVHILGSLDRNIPPPGTSTDARPLPRDSEHYRSLQAADLLRDGQTVGPHLYRPAAGLPGNNTRLQLQQYLPLHSAEGTYSISASGNVLFRKELQDNAHFPKTVAIFTVGECILLRMYQISKYKQPSFSTVLKRALLYTYITTCFD
jgi:hypothetical protein